MSEVSVSPPPEIKPIVPAPPKPEAQPAPSTSTPSESSNEPVATSETVDDSAVDGTEASTKPPEAETKKEVSRERQKEEVEIVGSLAIERKLQEVEKQLEGKKSEEVKKILKDQPNWIRALRFAKNPDPKNGVFDSPVPVVTTDGVFKIDKIVSITDDGIICEGRNETGALFPTKTISKESFYKGMVVAESDNILKDLQGSQKEAAQLYIDYLKNGEKAFDGKSPEEVNKIITEGADSVGLLTKDDLEAFIKKHYENLGKEQGANTDDLKGEMSTLLIKLNTKGINLADPETISTLLFESNALSPDSIDPLIDEIRGEIVGKTKQMIEASGEDKKNIEADIARLKVHRRLLEKAQESLNPENIQNVFANIEQGKISPEAMQSIKLAMRSADPNRILDSALTADTDFAKEAAQLLKKEHREKFLKTLGKGGAMAALAMLLMMYAGLKGESQH